MAIVRGETLLSRQTLTLSGERVSRILDDIASVRGYPKTVVLDNGPEMRSKPTAAKRSTTKT